MVRLNFDIGYSNCRDRAPPQNKSAMAIGSDRAVHP